MEIHVAVKEMLKIVEALHNKYPKKQFTLDGRLVGDLGEILAEEEYAIELYEGLQKHHDGETSDGRCVQIKTTMKNALTFPVDHIPQYYLGIKLHADGTFSEIFNGPGLAAWESIKNRAATKNNLHSIQLSTLEALSKLVKPEDRIPRRKRND